jgi:hypothetical protein
MMTDEDFDDFVEHATDELERKQDFLTASHGLGQYESLWFDGMTGTLQFKDADAHVRVEASVTPIGSFSEKSGTWQWAWANRSVVESLRQKSEKLKELHDITGMDVFMTPTFEADEKTAWEIAAMAVSHLACMGCYRIPTEHLYVFLGIDSIESGS